MSAESSNLSNIEHRAVIKYFVKKTPKEILKTWYQFFRNLRLVYDGQKWARLFQQGRESCEDDPRPGRPVTVVTEENVRKIEKLVLADRRIKLWQIAEELQISKERVGEIIHEHMNMRKISARWSPCNGRKRRKAAEEIQGSKVGIEAYGDNFWDSEGVLLIDYLPTGTTMNGQYYANLLAQAREVVIQKRRGKLLRGVLFLQDNASVHTARVSRQALKDTGFSEIDHPPYSPDLAPSDYFLFSNLKKELRGRRFVDDNQMKMTVESHFDCKEKEYFLGGLKALYTTCEKCISLEGDYIEK
ncbi:Mariner Mos1 transposase [Eumeta japonica]|uniref:Mariner Mos1 transposase n=1 Tax=Eumeta variegata TaxID=151549 RepID=A0A4C1ZGH5_EUMVA|nr:Mariner Mos1 transposase [Eumeta japonica]